MDNTTRFRSSILGTMTPGVFALAILSTLLLIVSRPAHAQTESVLFTFCDQNLFTFGSGSNLRGPLVLDSAGNLYGTTDNGGPLASGTVWKLSLGKKGWEEKVLHTFDGPGKDGFVPLAGVVLDAAGNVYRTTVDGGTGYGIVFELVAPLGKGAYKEKVLWAFNATDGADPSSSLFLDSAGDLYGTASGGQPPYGGGVVFEVTP
ncbi:MAG: choice-of-anchor tandem repeat GloVer-containing protein [Terriglobales bacterium]|jgi:outer membrane protein assembly factor BamB